MTRRSAHDDCDCVICEYIGVVYRAGKKLPRKDASKLEELLMRLDMAEAELVRYKLFGKIKA